MSGKRQDGIRTLRDLYGRCRADSETGCLLWAGAKNKEAPNVWLANYGSASMSRALKYITSGVMPTGRVTLVPTCGNIMCANMKHRKEVSASEFHARTQRKATASRGAKVTAAWQARSKTYTPEVHAEIMCSTESLDVMALRYGMHKTTVSKIRLGKRWRSLPAASVFAWRPT